MVSLKDLGEWIDLVSSQRFGKGEMIEIGKHTKHLYVLQRGNGGRSWNRTMSDSLKIPHVSDNLLIVIWEFIAASNRSG
jgi:hypothetical protein